MKQRNIFAVLLLPLITFGIYGLVWLVKTKNEMNNLGATIPTAWLLIVPFVNLYWMWMYAEGVGRVTNDKLSAIVTFILQFFLGSIGNAIIQDQFNKVATDTAAAPVLQPAADSPSATA